MNIEKQKNVPWILLFFVFFLFTGLITTTARKLDRENQSEHILEVCILFFFLLFSCDFSFYFLFLVFCCHFLILFLCDSCIYVCAVPRDIRLPCCLILISVCFIESSGNQFSMIFFCYISLFSPIFIGCRVTYIIIKFSAYKKICKTFNFISSFFHFTFSLCRCRLTVHVMFFFFSIALFSMLYAYAYSCLFLYVGTDFI